jgi:hypothetical protein
VRLKNLTILTTIMVLLIIPLAAQDDVMETPYSEGLRDYVLKDFSAAEESIVAAAATTAAGSETNETATLPVTDENTVTESTETSEESNAAEEPPVETDKKSVDAIPFGFSLGPIITFANSNQPTIDSQATLLGLMADAWIYLPFWDTRIGFQARYSQGRYISKSSAPGENIATHRFVGSALIRTWLFDNDTYRTTVGGSLSYIWFINQNPEPEEAYLIRQLVGPGFGFFIEDPIIARFADGSFSRNLSFKLSTETYFSSDSGELLVGLDFDIGATYQIGIMGIAVGYDLFALFLAGATETYNSIYVKAVAAF